MRCSVIVVGVFAAAIAATAAEPPAATTDEPPGYAPISTFSVVACDPQNEEWGVAVQSRVLAVGSLVPFAKAGAGAIATQSYANTTFGPRGLKRLAEGKSARETVDALIESDEGRDRRQLAIVDAQGRVAHYTGEKCLDYAGAVTGKHFSCQGNILAGEEVLQAMAKAIEETEGPLADRLLAALIAGQAAGGDTRGQQSAALLVVREGAGYGGFGDRMIDLRVDDHEKPIEELGRLLDLRLRRKR